MRKKEKTLVKEFLAEEVCFVCKDKATDVRFVPSGMVSLRNSGACFHAVLHGKAGKIFCSAASTIFSIIMYDSILSLMSLVIRTKSVEFMSFFLSLFVFLCGISWFIFGLLGGDPFVWVPNGCGTTLRAMQLILYATYRKNKGPEAATEVEIDGLKLHLNGVESVKENSEGVVVPANM